MAVTYRGPVEELQGSSWNVPDAVLNAGQAARWIESQHRQAQAEEAARVEAERRQQELLSARLEQQRRQAEAEQEALANAPAATRDELKAELQEELDALTRSVLTGAAAVESRELRIVERCDEWELRHEDLLSGAEAVISEAKAQVQFSNATTQVDHEQINAELDAAQQRISSLESELRTVVMTLTGPQGDRGERGLAGSGVGYVDADPRKLEQGSLGKRIYGRAVVPGDLLLQRTPDALKVWRTPDGKGWQQVDQIVNAQELVSQQLAVTDRSTQVTSLQTVSGSGGAGGGGGEHLLVNRIALGAAIAVADSSNWAGVSDVTSGQIVAELTALDGSLRGRTYLVLIPFTWSPAGDQFTVDGELGGLTGLYDINVSVQRSPAVAPAVFTGAMPPGSTRTVVFLSVVPSPGGGGDTTSFRLGGDIEWAHIAQGAAVSVQTGGLQPLWIWS